MRRSLSLEKSVLTDRFVCESEDEHVYDYTLILRDPVALSAAQCDTLPEYGRISQVTKATGKGDCRFELRDGTGLALHVNGPYDLYTGVAPGIPPKGLEPGEDVYPLILRTKGKKMEVEVTWELVD